ncbi:hypothetical protein BAE44_0025529, partial [Dichanthelium oligosanthes]
LRTEPAPMASAKRRGPAGGPPGAEACSMCVGGGGPAVRVVG